MGLPSGSLTLRANVTTPLLLPDVPRRWAAMGAQRAATHSPIRTGGARNFDIALPAETILVGQGPFLKIGQFPATAEFAAETTRVDRSGQRRARSAGQLTTNVIGERSPVPRGVFRRKCCPSEAAW